MDAGTSGGVATGVTFETWSTTVPVQARIFAQLQGADGSQPWGPGFVLDPAFGEVDVCLLGRADFFRFFRVCFEEDAAAPAFTVAPR